MYISSESDSDHLPRASRASSHGSDEQDITDEGHEADDETNARLTHEQQIDMDIHADSIELRELKRSTDAHSKVDAAYFLICTRLITS